MNKQMIFILAKFWRTFFWSQEYIREVCLKSFAEMRKSVFIPAPRTGSTWVQGTDRLHQTQKINKKQNSEPMSLCRLKKLHQKSLQKKLFQELLQIVLKDEKRQGSFAFTLITFS
jgi:hypothetical protein